MIFCLFFFALLISALQVADTQKHADRAAKLAVVEYDTNNLEEPILTVEDAVKRSSFFDVHPMFYPEPVGDVLEGMKEADRKILLAEVSLNVCSYILKLSLSHASVCVFETWLYIFSSGSVHSTSSIWSHKQHLPCRMKTTV